MALPGGLEPPTCRLEGDCSILLSYGSAPARLRGGLGRCKAMWPREGRAFVVVCARDLRTAVRQVRVRWPFDDDARVTLALPPRRRPISRLAGPMPTGSGTALGPGAHAQPIGRRRRPVSRSPARGFPAGWEWKRPEPFDPGRHSWHSLRRHGERRVRHVPLVAGHLDRSRAKAIHCVTLS